MMATSKDGGVADGGSGEATRVRVSTGGVVTLRDGDGDGDGDASGDGDTGDTGGADGGASSLQSRFAAFRRKRQQQCEHRAEMVKRVAATAAAKVGTTIPIAVVMDGNGCRMVRDVLHAAGFRVITNRDTRSGHANLVWCQYPTKRSLKLLRGCARWHQRHKISAAVWPSTTSFQHIPPRCSLIKGSSWTFCRLVHALISCLKPFPFRALRRFGSGHGLCKGLTPKCVGHGGF